MWLSKNVDPHVVTLLICEVVVVVAPRFKCYCMPSVCRVIFTFLKNLEMLN